MRYVADCNPNKRGCIICADVKTLKCWSEQEQRTRNRQCCPYDECPYHELDDFKRYSDYDKHAKSIGRNLLAEWMKKIFVLSEKYIDCQKNV